MFKVYIIQSLVNNRYYIGHTEDVDKRITKHNAGEVKSTKYGKPWKIIYLEEYSSRSDAYQRELEIKSYKGGIKFKKLLGLWKD